MIIATVLRSKGAEVIHVGPGETVPAILELLHSRGIGAVLVCDGQSVEGVVSERDLVRCLAQRREAVLELAARDVMTAPVISVPPTTTHASTRPKRRPVR
jgi:CBS domain-containing protein